MTRIAVFGCGNDERVLFEDIAARCDVDFTITEAPLCEANVKLATGSRCISVGHKSAIPNSALRTLRRAGVGYVSTRSIGYNHIDVAYAESIGIAVGNVAYSPDSVADYTLMLVLMAMRNAKSIIRRTETHDYRLHHVPGKELRDLTVGVVGTGRIGAAVINRLCGFGCEVLAHDNRPTLDVRYVPFDELLQRSDIVTLHLPLDSQTHHLLDADRIAAMKAGALVVNTGRGALVDTGALLAALESGRLGGAALDVIEGEEGIFYTDRSSEPVENDLLLRLHALPNVLISPHTAYYTDHALRDAVENSVINCLAFEREAASWTG